MNLTEYYKLYGSIAQESEKLFIADFLYPLVCEKIDKGPQYPFLDRTGKNRRIDFAIQGSHGPRAFEVIGGDVPRGTYSERPI